jgi:ATP-dependent RNA helicase DeaD
MKFSDLNLHPAVAAALVARGYDTATPVQAAVLDPRCAGRDLLVSSQTGSGKTIAFGAALAETLLAPDAERGPKRINPLALVIVPTRELAVQVREELGWLLKDTKLRLASFTGGTAVSGDLRVLQRGLDIAIGTPGRLVDLLRRQRLELADIEVAVLDEADEMLDLGFREDLQTLLQAAPATRRTLMLSATIPPEIQSLARRFQRDALPIDPRKDAGAPARGAHGDITFVAHLIAAADRLAVVVNLLRAAGNGRAIVFCTTREGVSRLHTALVARGFAATAISGDRAQAERDRALDQVRKGDARVLVATNVAARGIHLPDVDLIVHADLPLNAESLTHRSGRTGRAGRKGTAVVLAGLSERRKAERLLSAAHVPVVWTAPPSADAITAAARERLAEQLLQDTPTDDAAPAEDPAAEEMLKRMETTLPIRDLARRLLLREFGRLPIGERVHHVPVPGPGSARDSRSGDDRFGDDRFGGPPAGRRPGRGEGSRPGVQFRVNIGARDNADPRWLLPLFCRRGGITSRDVGAIRIGPNETSFEINPDVAADFARAASERDPRAPNVTIEQARSNGPGPGPGPSRERDLRPPYGSTARPAGSAPRYDKESSKKAPKAVAPTAALSATERSTSAPGVARPAASPHIEKEKPVAPPVAAESSHFKKPVTSASLPAAPHVKKPTVPGASAGQPHVKKATVPDSPAAQPHVKKPAATPHSPVSPAAPRGPVHAHAPSEKPAREHQADHRAGRPKPHVPQIEMKRPHLAGNPKREARDHRPNGESSGSHRPDGPSPVAKRSHPTGPSDPERRSHAHRPDTAPRGSNADRPRTDGTNALKRSFSSSAPSSSPSAPPKIPFWKQGARPRPLFQPRRDEGHAQKAKKPIDR